MARHERWIGALAFAGLLLILFFGGENWVYRLPIFWENPPYPTHAKAPSP